MNIFSFIIQFILFELSQNAQGQVYKLTASSSYGIKGQDFSFTCEIPGDAVVPFLLLFSQNDTEVCKVDPETCNGLSTRYSCGCINNNKKLYYMNLSSLSQSDEANYSCKEVNDNGGRSEAVFLPVYYGPDNITFSPYPVQVVENSKSEIECKSDCKPACSITWYKGSATAGIKLSSINGRLTLIDIKREDDIYICQANNTVLPPRTKILRITVFYGPDYINIQPPMSTVVENSTINITCTSDCNPPCTVKWYKDPSPVQSDNKVLFLPSINRDQHGNYTCQVWNRNIPRSTKTKIVHITVNYPPTIKQIKPNNTNRTQDEGSRVEFSCSVKSQPSSNVTWSRSERRQLSTTKQYILPNATCRHTDNYTCTASNNIDQSVSRTVPLYIKCSPRKNKKTKTRVVNKINSTVILELNIIAYPEPSFYWTFNKTQQAFKSTDEEISVNTFNSKIQIKLNESMFGEYIVIVNNSVGNTTYSFTISNEPPKKIDEHSQTIMITIGVSGAIVLIIALAVIFLISKWKQREDDSIPMESRNGGQVSTNTISKSCKNTPEEDCANSNITRKEKKVIINKEGLIYADVDFSDIKGTKNPVIRKEEEVEYAQIQPGVCGPTPPPIVDSDEDA